MEKVILCIGTLDTKGTELLYVKQLIDNKSNFKAMIMDVGCLDGPYFQANITAEEVAEAAGRTIGEIRAIDEAGPAIAIMTSGAKKIAGELYNSGYFQGILSIGGGTGSAIASAVMKELPIGLPKFMLSSQKIVQAGIRQYIGTRDIVIMPSVADIAGLNRLTIDALNKAVGAITGMMEMEEQVMSEKPLIFMTMTGLSTGCGLTVKTLLEEKGFEVGVFHTIGVGGETFEEMVKRYPVTGVIELGLNEIGNELFGGLASAGPDRLEAAGKLGIPQIITPGCIDIINFLSPETVPEYYRDRVICYHNPQATLPRMNAEELRQVAETISRKLNMATGKVKFLIPLRGFSSIDKEGNDFHNAAADRAFIQSLKETLKKDIEIKEVDAHINDIAFSHMIVNEFINIIKVSKD
ncbi:Tm-1-like ATP-binding domain-containing protein [Chloroflexota bacterium]